MRRALPTRIAQTWRRLRGRMFSSSQSKADDISTWLSLLCGVSLVLWLIGGSAIEFGEDLGLWWHARIAEDLVPVRVRVIAHDFREYSGDGSWAHKGSPASSRSKWYYVHPVIEVEHAPVGAAPPVRARKTFPESFDRRAKAQSHLEGNYPVGAEVAVLQWPGRPERIFISANEAPGLAGLLGRLLLEIVLFLFIWLPLAVLFALLVPPAIVWAVVRLFGGRVMTGDKSE